MSDERTCQAPIFGWWDEDWNPPEVRWLVYCDLPAGHRGVSHRATIQYTIELPSDVETVTPVYGSPTQTKEG